MNAFVDTNVPISYSFLIDPLHHNANVFSDKYNHIYCSERVKNEFDKAFIYKIKILDRFYKKLLLEIKYGTTFEEVTLKKLRKYVKSKNYSEKEYKQINGSLKYFWGNFVDSKYMYRKVSNEFFIESVNNCLRDLKVLVYTRKTEWENKVNLTEKRTSSYDELKTKLKGFWVHYPDFEIVLDAHDWNIKNDFGLDFVTFDTGCYEGVVKIKDFSFNAVKGKDDFRYG